MTFCMACGGEAPEGGANCPRCGAPLQAPRSRVFGFPRLPSWLALLWALAVAAAVGAILVFALT